MARTRAGWIVCEQQTFRVAQGAVSCHLRGRTPIGDCLDCHLLMAWSGERNAPGWCEVGVGGPFAQRLIERTTGAGPT